MTLHKKQAHFTTMFVQLILHACALGLTPVIGEVARTLEQQRLYVKQGKSQTLDSKHVQRLAGDLLVFRGETYLTRSEDYEPLGVYWESLDSANVWGGRWLTLKDGNHFEYGG